MKQKKKDNVYLWKKCWNKNKQYKMLNIIRISHKYIRIIKLYLNKIIIVHYWY